MQRYAIFGLSRVMDNTFTITELMLGGSAKKLYREKYMNFPCCASFFFRENAKSFAF
jgi:hypothetical protein